MNKKMWKRINLTASIFVLIGALNWGLVAFGYNIVEMIFGGFGLGIKIVYYLIAISGLFVGYKLFK